MNQEQQIIQYESDAVSNPPPIVIYLPESSLMMHPAHFASAVGQTAGVVGAWIDNGYLPTVKVGRYQMINLVLLTENLSKGRVL